MVKEKADKEDSDTENDDESARGDDKGKKTEHHKFFTMAMLTTVWKALLDCGWTTTTIRIKRRRFFHRPAATDNATGCDKFDSMDAVLAYLEQNPVYKQRNDIQEAVAEYYRAIKTPAGRKLIRRGATRNRLLEGDVDLALPKKHKFFTPAFLTTIWKVLTEMDWTTTTIPKQKKRFFHRPTADKASGPQTFESLEKLIEYLETDPTYSQNKVVQEALEDYAKSLATKEGSRKLNRGSTRTRLLRGETSPLKKHKFFTPAFLKNIWKLLLSLGWKTTTIPKQKKRFLHRPDTDYAAGPRSFDSVDKVLEYLKTNSAYSRMKKVQQALTAYDEAVQTEEGSRMIRRGGTRNRLIRGVTFPFKGHRFFTPAFLSTVWKALHGLGWTTFTVPEKRQRFYRRPGNDNASGLETFESITKLLKYLQNNLYYRKIKSVQDAVRAYERAVIIGKGLEIIPKGDRKGRKREQLLRNLLGDPFFVDNGNDDDNDIDDAEAGSDSDEKVMDTVKENKSKLKTATRSNVGKSVATKTKDNQMKGKKGKAEKELKENQTVHSDQEVATQQPSASDASIGEKADEQESLMAENLSPTSAPLKEESNVESKRTPKRSARTKRSPPAKRVQPTAKRTTRKQTLPMASRKSALTNSTDEFQPRTTRANKRKASPTLNEIAPKVDSKKRRELEKSEAEAKDVIEVESGGENIIVGEQQPVDQNEAKDDSMGRVLDGDMKDESSSDCDDSSSNSSDSSDAGDSMLEGEHQPTKAADSAVSSADYHADGDDRDEELESFYSKSSEGAIDDHWIGRSIQSDDESDSEMEDEEDDDEEAPVVTADAGPDSLAHGVNKRPRKTSSGDNINASLSPICTAFAGLWMVLGRKLKWRQEIKLDQGEERHYYFPPGVTEQSGSLGFDYFDSRSHVVGFLRHDDRYRQNPDVRDALAKYDEALGDDEAEQDGKKLKVTNDDGTSHGMQDEKPEEEPCQPREDSVRGTVSGNVHRMSNKQDSHAVLEF